MYYGLHTPQGVFVLKLRSMGEIDGMLAHEYTFGTLDDQEIFKSEYFMDRPEGYTPEGKGVAIALFQYLFGAGSRVNQLIDEMTEEQSHIYNHINLIELRFALMSDVGYPIEGDLVKQIEKPVMGWPGGGHTHDNGGMR
jgi:hypothetical protein